MELDELYCFHLSIFLPLFRVALKCKALQKKSPIMKKSVSIRTCVDSELSNLVSRPAKRALSILLTICSFSLLLAHPKTAKNPHKQQKTSDRFACMSIPSQ